MDSANVTSQWLQHDTTSQFHNSLEKVQPESSSTSALTKLENASNNQRIYDFHTITKPRTYVTKCVKSSNWPKFDCSSLKNDLKNDHNAKISNWVKGTANLKQYSY